MRKSLIGGISVQASDDARLEYYVLENGCHYVGIEATKISSLDTETTSVYFSRRQFKSIDELIELARRFLRLEVYPVHLVDVAEDFVNDGTYAGDLL